MMVGSMIPIILRMLDARVRSLRCKQRLPAVGQASQ